MNRPNFEPIFTEKSDFCEVSSEKPFKSFIPGQANKLSDLVARFERGQRLNVHSNFDPLSNFTKDSLYQEDFDDAPPDDVHDVVDVQRYYEEHQEHKKDYKVRMKTKKEAQQAAKQASQATDKPDQAIEPIN